MVERSVRPRRFPWWVFLTLAALAAAGYAWFATLNDAKARRELEVALQEASSADLPTQIEDDSTMRRPGGAEADYQLAFEAYYAELESLRHNLPGPEEPNAKLYLEHVDKRRNILPIILKACTQPYCAFPVVAPRLEEATFEAEFFEHPEDRLYEFAIWTNREARVASLEGDWPRCLRYLKATAQLSQHAGQQLGFAAALASSKIDRGLITTMSLIAGDHKSDTAWLANLDAFIGPLPPAYAFKRAAFTEMARSRELLRQVVEGKRFDLAAEGPTTDDAEFARKLQNEATRSRWEAAMVKRFTAALEALPAESSETVKAIAVWKDAFKTDDPFEAMFFARFVGDGADTFKRLPTIPRHKVMRAVLAFMQHRIRTRKDPVSPSDLGQVARDPYGTDFLKVWVIREPMVRVKETINADRSITRVETPLPTLQVRKLLYSVGQNGKDNRALGDDVYVFIPGVEIVKR
jgi:hypothetical protein